MEKEELIKFCEHHIEMIEKHLDKVYTIDCPSGYNENSSKDGKINLYKELARLNKSEELYATIEKTGIEQGELYERYSEWLKAVRKSKIIVEKELEKIKIEYAADIEVAEKLLNEFKKTKNIESAFG